MPVHTIRASQEGGSAPKLSSSEGMVTSNHHLASVAGATILEMGGNAFDAATAASFAVGVVEPGMSGLGGRANIVTWHDDKPLLFDGDPGAPSLATAEMFVVESGGEAPSAGWGPLWRVKDNANSEGPLASVVPSSVRTVCAMHARFGLLPLSVVMHPAMELARNGFPADIGLVSAIIREKDKLSRNETAAATFLPGGRVPAVGEMFIQGELSQTLERIAIMGPDELYAGATSRSIVQEIKVAGGRISADDLLNYRPRIHNSPLTSEFRGRQMLGWPGASGSLTLFEILNIFECLEDGSSEYFEPQTLSALTLSMRRAFEDRWDYADDPDFSDVPIDLLVSKEHARARALDVGPAGTQAHVAGSQRKSDVAPMNGSEHTTHICAVDGSRNIVSLTQSLWHEFGSGVMIPGTGILMNSAMHAFTPLPAMRGSIAPGKRGPQSGTPMIILSAEGKPEYVLGGAGGTKIISGVAQVVIQVVDSGAEIQSAVGNPRLHAEGSSGGLLSSALHSVLPDHFAHHEDLEVVAESFGEPQFARVNGIHIDNKGTLHSGVDVWVDAGAASFVDE